jgi:hypothetical protein
VKFKEIGLLIAAVLLLGCTETPKETDPPNHNQTMDALRFSIDSLSSIMESQSYILDEFESGSYSTRVKTDSLLNAETELYKLTVRNKEGELYDNNLWALKLERLVEIKYFAKAVSNFLVEQASEMIITSDPNATDLVQDELHPIIHGEFYYKDAEGFLHLFPFNTLSKKDDYEVPTQLFVGDDPQNPNKVGLEIRKRLLRYCNVLCSYMTEFTFKSSDAELAIIRKINRTLKYPDTVTYHGENVPWVSGMFDHAPIIAAASLFKGLITDVHEAENLAITYLNHKEI